MPRNKDSEAETDHFMVVGDYQMAKICGHSQTKH